MTPRTRTTNKDANYKVYYSKKVPQQTRFPHRERTVRRQHGKVLKSPKQMKFLPEKMHTSAIRDSEDEGSALSSSAGEEIKMEDQVQAEEKGTNRKRSRHAVENSQDERIEDSGAKRRRRSPRKRTVRREISIESGSEHTEPPEASTDPVSEQEDRVKPRRRRQSTMTQLVEGRMPDWEDEEPDFQPVKRARSSIGSAKRKGKDQKQRTLTQMIPGRIPLGLISDSDLDDDIEVEGQGEMPVAPNADTVQRREAGAPNSSRRLSPKERASSPRTRGSAAEIHVDADDEDEEDEYQPTQDVREPDYSQQRSTRHLYEGRITENSADRRPRNPPLKARRTRFSLLATPERRNIREIASSQSPPDTPLSSQSTPGNNRFPLRDRSGNAQKVLDTPSKLKRVTFEEPSEVQEPPSPTRRKFGSVVLDSEDDDSDIEDDDYAGSQGRDIGAETQKMISALDSRVKAREVGPETQEILGQIDAACADAEQDEALAVMSEEDEEPEGARNQQVSPELGEILALVDDVQNKPRTPQRPSCGSAQAVVKQEPQSQVPSPQSSPVRPTGTAVISRSSVPGLKEERTDSQIQVPSSPMLIKAEAENDAMSSSAPSPDLPPQSTSHNLTDLDGEPIVASTRASGNTQDTNDSHSSKAEQQLHAEWQRYSQYAVKREQPSSSLHVLQADSSYQNATPYSDPTIAPLRWSAPLSQATTADVTQRSPRKLSQTPRKQGRIASSHTTPSKVPSSMPFVSPSRPPTLVIASSYPSPERADVGQWSSPVMGPTQMQGLGSIEDFSIPLPPGFDEIEDDEL